MPYLLALLGSVVTILILLYRLAALGISLGGLNPFAWRRRRAWRQRYDAKPVFSLEDPREIAGILATSVAKIDGDSVGGAPTPQQAELIGAIKSRLQPQSAPQGTWG
jgi:hypothetical protein